MMFFRTGHAQKEYGDAYYQGSPVVTEGRLKICGKRVCVVGIDSCSPDSEPYD